MSDRQTYWAPGGPAASNSSVPAAGSSLMPRRSSYASVLSGTAQVTPQIAQQPTRAGALAHLASQASPPAYIPTQTPRHHSRHPSRGLDMDGHQTGGANSGSGSGIRNSYLPPYSSQYGSVNFSSGSYEHGGPPSIFTPTYLKESKYVERLNEAHEAHEAHKARLDSTRDRRSSYSSNGGSLSTSSSSANLHKMTPSYRGMTFDIVEKEDDRLLRLPSKWNERDKMGPIEIQGDGRDVRFVGPGKSGENEGAAVRADHAMPPQCGIYYYEITIQSKGKEGGMIGVGFSGPKVNLGRLPGWEPESWGYHGDDGNAFSCNNSGKPYAPPFTTNDVIGCGVNFRTNCAFFTKNGMNLGIAFRDCRGPLYPSVGMRRPGEHIRVNFGQFPFIFDIDGMVAKEKEAIMREINLTSAATLNPPLGEDTLIRTLIAQYLAHDGYVETARAFHEDIYDEWKSLKLPEIPKDKLIALEEDQDAVHRQQIRRAILDGDVDKAIKYTEEYYPTVLNDNPQIYFRLRCRKFIEMTKSCSELLNLSHHRPVKRHPSSTLNGHSHHPALYGDVFVNDMELDEHSTVPAADADGTDHDWEKMETEDATNNNDDANTRYKDSLAEMISYGQELRREFGDDSGKEKALEDTFHLIAYDDPMRYKVAHLLEPAGRTPVAEELNGAILVSLGKLSSSSLERLYQQTEVLIDELSEEGGPGAFVNVAKDIIR